MRLTRGPAPAAPTLEAGARRLAVVGCSGSGKTTLAQELARRLDAEHIELDAINNLAGWRDRARVETRAIVTERVRASRWVVDGNYDWLAADIWPLADVVIILDPPLRTVLRRVVVRTVARVVLRRTLWNGNRETWSNVFSRDPRRSIIRWAWRRHPEYRRKYRALLDAGSEVRLLHLTSASAVRRFLRTVSARSMSEKG